MFPTPFQLTFSSHHHHHFDIIPCGREKTISYSTLRLIKKLFVSLLMSCVIVFPLNLRLIIESRCRVRKREREWCGVVWCGEEWKKSIRIENFFSYCCSNAISRRRPRDDDDNDEDIECEFYEELFLSLPTCWLSWQCQACVCVESLKIELWK